MALTEDVITKKAKYEIDLMICLPGSEWDINQEVCFARLQAWLNNKGINYMVSREGGSNVCFVRESCLGIRTEQAVSEVGVLTKPWNGEIDYKHILWLDSDIIFEPEQVGYLLESDKYIVSGFYKKGKGVYTSSLYHNADNSEKLRAMTDEDFIVPSAEYQMATMNYGTGNITEPKKEERTGLIRLKTNGMGFVLFKKGVFENIPRPWFQTTTIDYGQGQRFVGEDTYFFLTAEKCGFELWGDPRCRVKHMKKSLLY